MSTTTNTFLDSLLAGRTAVPEKPHAWLNRLRAAALEQHATPFMALLAAFTLVLARWSGQDDVVVGTPVAGRTRRETEGLIGLFVNTLPIRTGLEGDPSFRALLGRVREATLRLRPQALPFDGAG